MPSPAPPPNPCDPPFAQNADWCPVAPVVEDASVPAASLEESAPTRVGVDFTRVAEIVQTVLTALILAFVFRAFLVEPFIIPTGSMAPTLLGTHASWTCPACGWVYDVAPLGSSSPTGTGFIRPPETFCPNCQIRLVTSEQGTLPRAGDRILVHKWLYACGLYKPERWDVIVFRDPADPEQHYIKRLVGLPGETLEILDGDLFINGRVARKPRRVQEALWQVVFDQNHVPRPDTASSETLRWVPGDVAGGASSGWQDTDGRTIRYAGLDAIPRSLRFDALAGPEYLMDVYAYDRGSSGQFVGDVRLLGELTLANGSGLLTLTMTRPPYRYHARLAADGQVVLERAPLDDGPAETLAVGRRAAWRQERPLVFEFAYVDHLLTLQIDEAILAQADLAPSTSDLDRLRTLHRRIPLGIELAAENLEFELRGLRIDRDVHYTESPHTLRAYAGHPFVLSEREYFVLGDNSPDSHDSREWTRRGPHLPLDYRPGTVPADQIVGRAAFVYLPGLQALDPAVRVPIPDVGRVRFIR